MIVSLMASVAVAVNVTTGTPESVTPNQFKSLKALAIIPDQHHELSQTGSFNFLLVTNVLLNQNLAENLHLSLQ